ncbi:ATP-binding cassette domain-containing protein [Streptomyces zaomyceticus]|uniref:ATP-binding cassette domain-containing protein n=1 Tax=Streptomyces zaomyceticus TaxID=68286 RepID=UPI0037AF5397
MIEVDELTKRYGRRPIGRPVIRRPVIGRSATGLLAIGRSRNARPAADRPAGPAGSAADRPAAGRLAVDRLGFTVRPGRVTGFLGPNGAGKSTTLRLVLGLDEPTSGSATVDGRRFRELSRGLRHVGALLDAHDVHGGRTAEGHLAALARTNGIPRRRVVEVLAEAGLAEAARRRIGDYSLGMKQRLGIAAALLGDPPVLLFDEPVNGLDPEGVLWARGLFRRLAAEGRTVFVSSHLMSEMEHTADDLVVIGRGRLIAAESLADFAARGTGGGAGRGVTVRTADPAEGSGLAAVLTRAGATVRAPQAAEGPLVVTGMGADRIGVLAFRHGTPLAELSSRGSSLEDAFMELTADSVEYRRKDGAR